MMDAISMGLGLSVGLVLGAMGSQWMRPAPVAAPEATGHGPEPGMAPGAGPGLPEASEVEASAEAVVDGAPVPEAQEDAAELEPAAPPAPEAGEASEPSTGPQADASRTDGPQPASSEEQTAPKSGGDAWVEFWSCYGSAVLAALEGHLTPESPTEDYWRYYLGPARFEAELEQFAQKHGGREATLAYLQQRIKENEDQFAELRAKFWLSVTWIKVAGLAVGPGLVAVLMEAVAPKQQAAPESQGQTT